VDAVVAVALLSALLHAAWNAAVRAAADPRRAMAAQIVASGLVVAPLLLVLPLPSPEALPWLAAPSPAACSPCSRWYAATRKAGASRWFIH
jgi:hypothetical protein